MGVLLVAELVVESLVEAFHAVRLVIISDDRASVIGEISFVTGFNTVVLVNLVFVVEFYLGTCILALAILELVALVCYRVVTKDFCCLQICGIAVLAPHVVSH